MSRKSSEILDFSVCASFMSHKSMRFGLFMHFRGHPLKTVISSGNFLPNTHKKFGGSEIFEGSKVGQRTNHRTNFLGGLKASFQQVSGFPIHLKTCMMSYFV